jgi:hypothetical protein
MMTIIYLFILVLAIFAPSDLLGIAFDASGNTTGAVSVPFILAISVGISALTRNREKEDDDGFGILGIASTGAIIAVLFQGIFSPKTKIEGSLPISDSLTTGLVGQLLSSVVENLKETFIVLMPIIVIYLIIELIWIKQPLYKVKRILIGGIYTYIGLVLFLTGINVGFLEASRFVGRMIAENYEPWVLIVVGMIFGVITIPAEPSVHILTRQIEDNTSGSIKAIRVMLTLCIGVAVAVGLSMLRILMPSLQLWHIILPGMIIAIALSYIVPNIFVGIAFDSGGVAAGTMTSVFILPFAQGASNAIPGSNIMNDSFGIIAIVAITPLIAVQLLGLIYKVKSKRLLSETVGTDVNNTEEC